MARHRVCHELRPFAPVKEIFGPGRRAQSMAVAIEGGIRGRLKRGYCARGANPPGERLELPKVGQCIEVIVRAFNWHADEVLVSMHRYQEDPKYCAFASGYRDAYWIHARRGNAHLPRVWQWAYRR